MFRDLWRALGASANSHGRRTEASSAVAVDQNQLEMPVSAWESPNANLAAHALQLVDRALCGDARLSDVETINLLLSVMGSALDSDVPQSWHLVGERVAWVFGDDTVLNVTLSEGVFLSHLSHKLDPESSIGWVIDATQQFSTEWRESAHAFRITSQGNDLTVDELARLINRLAEQHGAPTVELPWTPSAIGDMLDRFETDEDDGLLHIRFFSKLEKVDEALEQVDGLAWPCLVEESYDVAMPYHCAYSKFERAWSQAVEAGWFIFMGTREWNSDIEALAIAHDETLGRLSFGVGTDTYPWHERYGRSGWIDIPLVFRNPESLQAFRELLDDECLATEALSPGNRIRVYAR